MSSRSQTPLIKYQLYNLSNNTGAIPFTTRRRWMKRNEISSNNCNLMIENLSPENLYNEDLLIINDTNINENFMSHENDYMEKEIEDYALECEDDVLRKGELEESEFLHVQNLIANDFDVEELEEESHVDEFCNIPEEIYSSDDENISIADTNKIPSYPIDFLIQSLLIMSTKMKKKLSYTDAETMVRFTNVFDTCNVRKMSKYYWKNILKSYSNFLTIHHFCKYCGKYVGPSPTKFKEHDTLLCKSCNLNFNIKENICNCNIFIYLSLAHQLSLLLQHNHDLIIDPTTLKSYAINIFGGKLYKQKPRDMISINCSLDGTPIHGSSNSSIYPLLCSVNELAPNDRKKNIMLVSLWFGTGKLANTREFLKPFVEECRLLYNTGFNYTFKGQTYTKKCCLLNFICDSVERPVVQGSTQFNGNYGCGLCLNKGKHIKKGKGYTHVYTVKKDNCFGNGLRDHESTLTHADLQLYGIKEKSILCEIPRFDVIKNLDVDWMHCVGLGVCRQFGNLWFHSSNKGQKFYFGKFLKTVNKILKTYEPSLDVSRTPRDMSDRIHWKAHEWIIWLLFYSLPTLQSLFPMQYVDHWSLLVDAIAILVKNSIMKSEILYAERCLLKFIKGVETLYGKLHMSFNVHLLSHLSDSVLNWGPLWTHSMFMYEDYNQILKSSVKSSNGVAVQVCDNFRMKASVDQLENLCFPYLTPKQKEYLNDLFGRNSNKKIACKINSSQGFLGRPMIIKKRRVYLSVLNRQKIVNKEDKITFYGRLELNKKIIHSSIYSSKKVKKRNSYTVFLKDNEIFEIEIFAVVKKDNLLIPYAIGRYFDKLLEPLLTGRRLDHLIMLKNVKLAITAVNVNSIIGKATLLQIYRTNKLVGCILPTNAEFLT